MLLRNAITEIKGLHYLVEKLEVLSSLGKRFLLDSEFLVDQNLISDEWNLIERFVQLLNDENGQELIEQLQIKLMQIRDIKGTINNTKNDRILDEIELFEIKSFLLLEDKMRQLLEEAHFEGLDFPNLEKEIELLDPESKRVPSFYIYDAYSPKLAACRKELKQKKSQLKALLEQKASVLILQTEVENLENSAGALEDEIRDRLSKRLSEKAISLELALNQVAHLDVLIAKALQTKFYALVKPRIVENSTSYKGLFNPQIKDILKEQGKDFQSIDINLQKSACLITGANMAGKTVVLRTLALCQYLAQFGFFVPANNAEVQLVEQIMISLGDEQNELSGLSSYASEMVKVNQMIAAVKSGKELLILIDELARTTNPYEGRAIVSAVIDILNTNKVKSVITTHYSKLDVSCQKLRVKGLKRELLNEGLNKNNINDYMDYTLIEDVSGSVPQEALWIAKLLGVDSEIISKAAEVLEREKTEELK